MHDILHRLAVALLAFAALAAFAVAWASGPAGELPAAQRHWMLLALAAALAVAVVVPALRIPAVAAALLAQGAYLAAVLTQPLAGQSPGTLAWDAGQVLMLAVAGAVFLHEARLEARWNGVLPLRQEG